MAVLLPIEKWFKTIKQMTKKTKQESIKEEQDVAQEQKEKKAEVKEQEPKPSVEESLKNELKAEKDKFLRLFAEFENYKKRTTRERIELFKTASEDVMVSLLPVLDDFERALSHIEEDKEAEELRKGVMLIYQKLLKTLEQKGLEVIKVEKGDTFDAEDHEAVTQIPAPDKKLKGKIIDVIEKGYKLGDKVIRFPKVVIGQ